MTCKMSGILFAILVAFTAQCTLADPIARQTTSGDAYKLAPFRLSDVNNIEFEVKACKDAYILLATSDTDESSNVVELGVGIGVNGDMSVLRTSKGQDPPLTQSYYNPLNCNEYQRFWVYWSSSMVCIGTGPYNNMHDGEFLTYYLSSGMPAINYFKVKTGATTGNWILGASCRIKGDPHTQTFDKKKYTFSGNCVYDLVNGINNLEIESDYDRCRGHRSCLSSVKLQYGSRRIYFQEPNMTKEGNILNNEIALPYTSSSGGLGLRVSEISNPASEYLYQVQVYNGVNVLWNGQTWIEVQVPMAYQNQLSGMCGTYNDDTTDDFTMRNGAVTEHVNDFGDSWEATTECRCDGGWKWHNDYCYAQVGTAMTYAQAKAQCENSYRGFLVHVTDEATNEFLETNFVTSTKQYWVGSTYKASKGKFVWPASGSLKESNVQNWGWLNGVPNNGASHSCVHYNVDGANKGWENVDCGASYPYLCQRKD